MKTVKEIWVENSKYAKIDLDILIAQTINKSKEFLYAHPNYKLGLFQRIKLCWLLKGLKKGMPIAHLTGHKEFFGLTFFVNKHVLTPRPATELMVEQVLAKIKQQKTADKHIILVDIGTGSGCIPIAILKTLSEKNKKIKTFATDISQPALKIAKKNARFHQVNIEFLSGSLLKPVLKKFKNKKFRLIITANLPYLTPWQHANEPSIKKEPSSSLIGGKDGLDLYRKLISQLSSLSANYRLPTTAYLEIDPSQSKKIMKVISNEIPKAIVKIKKDLAGQNRLIIISC